jgi:hypothetical protein
MRPAGGLVITSHVAGRLPRLIEFRPRPDLLAELIAELSGQAACAEVCPVAGLFAKHAGNLRHALLECYDDHARK